MLSPHAAPYAAAMLFPVVRRPTNDPRNAHAIPAHSATPYRLTQSMTR
jgi:hypothetical protein